MVPISIDIREDIKPGTYHVHVQPCGPGAVCGKDDSGARFDVQLYSGARSIPKRAVR
jgi:hypothetical protein